jgi:CHAT domain-containing protein
MAGQFGLTEPAIILTPDKASNWDGKLLASEISVMQLNADLVILSACDTATPEPGKLEDDFSALIRAFLRAGARAILATHWAVKSGPTVMLTTGFVAEMQGDPGLRKAEALRRSMRKLFDGPDLQLRHPALWAPFVIVGE